MIGQTGLAYWTLIRGERLLSRTGVPKRLKRLRPVVSAYRFVYRLLRPSGTITTTIRGDRVHLDPADLALTRHILLNDGVWEPAVTDAFLSLVKRGMVVVDVGANFGYYTLLAARAVGKEGKVYAFEPTPRSYELLCKNVRENWYSNVITVPKAVSNRSGAARFSLSPENPSTNKLLSNPESGTVLDVETITLDEYFSQLHSAVDVLKVDTEGAEELVLDGSTRVLEQSPRLILFTEFWPPAIRALGSSPEGYLNKLAAYGFSIFYFCSANGPIRGLQLDEISTFAESLERGGPGRNLVNLLCVRNQELPPPAGVVVEGP